MVLPILSRFQEDAHVKVVEIEPHQTFAEIAAACAHHSAGVHVPLRAGGVLRVRPTTDSDDAAPWPPDLTAAAAGIKVYDCLDIYYEDA